MPLYPKYRYNCYEPLPLPVAEWFFSVHACDHWQIWYDTCSKVRLPFPSISVLHKSFPSDFSEPYMLSDFPVNGVPYPHNKSGRSSQNWCSNPFAVVAERDFCLLFVFLIMQALLSLFNTFYKFYFLISCEYVRIQMSLLFKFQHQSSCPMTAGEKTKTFRINQKSCWLQRNVILYSILTGAE